MIELEHIIKDLERKANISREIHAYCSRKCKKRINIILIFTIILTIIITSLSLAWPQIMSINDDGKNIFGIIVAISGWTVLFLSVSDRIFGLNERCAIHNHGVKILTDFIRVCHQFRHIDLKEKDDTENLLKLEALQHEYSQLNQLLPINDINTSEFLKCKQKYLLKLEVSKKLDTNPYLDIDEAIKIKKR